MAWYCTYHAAQSEHGFVLDIAEKYSLLSIVLAVDAGSAGAVVSDSGMFKPKEACGVEELSADECWCVAITDISVNDIVYNLQLPAVFHGNDAHLSVFYSALGGLVSYIHCDGINNYSCIKHFTSFINNVIPGRKGGYYFSALITIAQFLVSIQ